MNAHRAEQLARRVHRDQVERFTGDPYIIHVGRVVALVGPDASDDLRAVAWLHDVLEDTPTTAADLTAHGFDPAVVRAVELLTKTGRGPEAYARYIETLRASGSALAIAVKRADLLDHLRPESPPPDAMRRKYEAALLALAV